jgi:hypothetical protein
MSDCSASSVIVPIRSDDMRLERLALVGFLAGYSGPTRVSSAAGSRNRAEPVPRSGGACRRWPGSTGTANRNRSWRVHRPPTSVARSRTTSPGRSGWTATNSAPFWVAAGLSSNRDHALASLLALNGLRISETLGADIDDLNVERGHGTLGVVRKGAKQVTSPLAPRTARAIDLAVGEREHGPILLGASGQRLALRPPPDRQTARPSRREHQADFAAQLAAQLHHRRFGRRGSIARRARRRLSCRPSHHDALRPGPPQPRPPRHVIVSTFVAGASR